MVTSKFIHLHSKCLAILMMIQKVNNRIEEGRSKLARYDVAKDFDNIRLFNTREGIIRRSEKNKAIKSRLVRYYAFNMAKLAEDTLAKCYPADTTPAMQD